jgi:hypothetical protein
MKIFLVMMLLSVSAFANETLNPPRYPPGRGPVRPGPTPPPPYRPRPPAPPPYRPAPPPYERAYYDWGQGRDGFGYCYEWVRPGVVLNGGAAVANFLCEQVHPSYYNWGRGRNGYTYCYQWTPYHLIMNQGAAVAEYFCR